MSLTEWENGSGDDEQNEKPKQKDGQTEGNRSPKLNLRKRFTYKCVHPDWFMTLQAITLFSADMKIYPSSIPALSEERSLGVWRLSQLTMAKRPGFIPNSPGQSTNKERQALRNTVTANLE